MDDIYTYLKKAVDMGASDVFVVAGAPVSVKTGSGLEHLDEERLLPDRTMELITEVYESSGRSMERLLKTGDDDFSFAKSGLARFRANAYKQRGSFAMIIRVVSFDIPSWEKLRIPKEVMNLANLKHGLVLFTGTACSGKSTTQACIIDRINSTRSCHIITLEDPIEFLHRDKMSIVSQREIAIDTEDFLSALRASLRQSPDVILVGEMRDQETIRAAITAAETGHLVMATLHTRGTVNTIDRIIDSFDPAAQTQIRLQLSTVLVTVVSQQLVPGLDGESKPAFEIMNATKAIASMIRDCKTHMINSAIATGASEGMITMDRSLLELYQRGLISTETALAYADAPEQMQRKLNG